MCGYSVFLRVLCVCFARGWVGGVRGAGVRSLILCVFELCVGVCL